MAVARVTSVISSSTTSFDDAVKEGLKRANNTLRGITELRIVVEQKCRIENDKNAEYRMAVDLSLIHI